MIARIEGLEDFEGIDKQIDSISYLLTRLRLFFAE